MSEVKASKTASTGAGSERKYAIIFHPSVKFTGVCSGATIKPVISTTASS